METSTPEQGPQLQSKYNQEKQIQKIQILKTHAIDTALLTTGSKLHKPKS